MSIIYNKTTITDVVYNNKPVYKVIYKKGTTSTVVFQKIISTTEKLSYYFTSASGQATFSYPTTETVTLAHAPTKVTKLVFTFGVAWKSWNVTINEDGLSGTFVLPTDSSTATGSGTNYKNLTWKISDKSLIVTGGTDGGAGTSSWVFNITYEYTPE